MKPLPEWGTAFFVCAALLSRFSGKSCTISADGGAKVSGVAGREMTEMKDGVKDIPSAGLRETVFPVSLGLCAENGNARGNRSWPT